MDENKDVVEVDPKLQKIAIDILDMISGGADEIEVCKHFRIRRGKFIQWMIVYPQFETAVVEARKQRADSYRSIIQDRMYSDEVDEDGVKTGKKIILEISKDCVPGEKLIFEQLKWLAEIDNPEKYGTKVKHEGGGIMPVQIVVDTGIKQQESKAQPIKAESVEVVQEDYKDMDF